MDYPIPRRIVTAWLVIGMLTGGGLLPAEESSKIELIRQALSSRLDAIQWRADGVELFRRNHSDLFPREEPGEWVRVRKEKLRLENGKTVSIGAAYSQVFIPAPMERVIRYLETPAWFRDIYNLDGAAPLGEGPGDTGCFQARIFKKIPLLPDQDFVLGFDRTWQGDMWVQRGRLVEDRKDFAVRDNLKILEPRDGGVMYHEISLIYPRRWWARAAGPTFRRIMRKEVRNILKVLRCVISGGDEWEPRRARTCWDEAGRD